MHNSSLEFGRELEKSVTETGVLNVELVAVGATVGRGRLSSRLLFQNMHNQSLEFGRKLEENIPRSW